MTQDRRRSRRTLLRGLGAGAAGVAGVGAVGPSAGRDGSAGSGSSGGDGIDGGWGAAPVGRATDAGVVETRVMTRNLALGADLSRLYDAASDELDRVAGELVSTAERSRFELRAAAIADELAAAEPAFVGLQEAVRVEVDGELRFDYLNALRRALADRGLDYRVAARVTNADVTIPAEIDDLLSVLTVVDRDVVLVRGDVTVERGRSGRYDAALEVTREGRTVTVPRGWAAVETTLAGTPFSFVTTHLESADATVRRAQARELVGTFAGREAVVVAGDVNDGPGDPDGSDSDGEATAGDGDGAYAILADAFDSAGALVGDPGPTCCQDSALRNRRSRLSVRLDHVFVDGAVAPVAVTLTGAAPADRIDTPDGPLWPSDHAGVVATLQVGTATPTPSPTPTPTPTPTATSTPTPPDESTVTPAAGSTRAAGAGRENGTGGERTTGGDSAVSVPGFGAASAVVALAAAVGAAVRRRRE